MDAELTIATCSLTGCFGCHMSLLDIDERIESLAGKVRFDRSPLTDIKRCGRCDIGFIEGGLSTEENVEVAVEFRRQCRILVAVGACAINGGVPAIRNQFSVSDCLQEAYLNGPGLESAQIPDDPELPLLLDKVRPLSDAVRVDYFLPGCPPSADNIWQFLCDLLDGRQPRLCDRVLRFD